MHHDIKRTIITSVPHKGKALGLMNYTGTFTRPANSYRTYYTKMDYLLKRTIKRVLVWRKHWKGEL